MTYEQMKSTLEMIDNPVEKLEMLLTLSIGSSQPPPVINTFILKSYLKYVSIIVNIFSGSISLPLPI